MYRTPPCLDGLQVIRRKFFFFYLTFFFNMVL